MKFNDLSKKAIDKVKNFRLTRRVFAYPYILFLLLFVVTPLVIVLINAFLQEGKITLQNFVDLATDGSSLEILGISIVVGIITTLICLLLGYPVAYILARWKSGSVVVMLFLLPMWVNFLIRTYALQTIFENMGTTLGIGTVIFGMVYNFIPFMIMPLHTTISNIDKSYKEASQDLGASPIQTFFKTTLPLSLPGIISGITMVFIPTISAFAISEMLSNNSIMLFGDSINLKFHAGEQLYGVGSVMSLIMLALVLISNFFMNKINKGEAAKNLW
ncbi:MAG: ABC transporter permease [Clostridia bacterium]|nr:ABC transporter permease [Clostridia bacterium]MBO7177594.1 ABC transporter permease [Clostridia bacterium]